MSIDKLQNQIRKLNNPSVVDFSFDQSLIPPRFYESAETAVQAYCQYAGQVLEALKGIVPAVRFGMGTFSLWGAEGMQMLDELLAISAKLGFYVFLDVPEIFSTQDAMLAAEAFLKEESRWRFDGLVLSCYIGSDAVKPFADRLQIVNDKDLYVVLRTGNPSALELQELLTGSRLVYTAAADIAKRLGEKLLSKSGYSRIGGVGTATSADSLRMLRQKYPQMFLIVEGYDYPRANAKNCSFAFDKFAHGAAVCAGASVVGAWKETYTPDGDFIAPVVQAAERMKKNLTRYITIL